jgi:hypothetical protein
MVVAHVSKPASDRVKAPCACRCDGQFIRIAAAGTLATGGVLLLTGQRRAGLVAAASGTALAMLDQRETLCAWWNALPACLDEVQGVLSRVQKAVDTLADQRDKLGRMLPANPLVPVSQPR